MGLADLIRAEIERQSTLGKEPTMTRVYLCGGINGLDDDEAKNWRARATAELGERFEIVDPMARDYRGVELDNVDDIVRGDLADIDSCDVILVRAERPSWGTAMEVHYSHDAHKYVVAFGAGDRPSPWLAYHADELVPTLDDALALLNR